MASYDVDAYGADVRVRDTSYVLILHAITLGLYNFYWYYKINRELRDFGKVYRLERCASVNPWLALAAVSLAPVAIFVGAIALAVATEPTDPSESSTEAIIFAGVALALLAPVASWYRTTKRIQEVQAVVQRQRLSGVALGFAYAGGGLFTPVWLVIPYMVQSALNDVWGSYRDTDPQTGRRPERIAISVGALASLPDAKGWDLSRLDEADLAAVGEFLSSREDRRAQARGRHALELEGRIRPLVPDAPQELEAERLLELVYAAADAERGEGVGGPREARAEANPSPGFDSRRELDG
ncbi:MAG: DUF4234 domain-containing protein [Solirubrobacterales bacterium]